MGYKSLLPTTYVQKPLVYNTPIVKPVVYNTPVVQPLVYKQAVPVVAPKYQAHSAGVSHTVLKREAEADPQLLYGGYQTYGYPAVKPVVYTKPVVYSAPVVAPVKTYANDAVKPFNYAAKGQYIANSAGVVHVAKREAEADPQLLYKSILPATTYVQKPVVYQTPVVKPVVYNTPVVYKQPEVVYKQPEAVVYKQAVPVVHKPIVYNAPIVTPVVAPLQVKTYANDAEKPEDYAAKGKYHAENAGAVHIAKREADPYTIGYNTFQTSPTSFVSAPIVTAQQPAFYTGLTAGLTTYSHLYKREAEAEPEAEAEAEPWMTYGGYGYAMPYMMSVGTPYSPNYYVGMRRGGYYGSRGYGYGNYGNPYMG